jgi:hydroxyethylthiazole kinase
VHSITNIVVANSTANALLAIGASPAMAESTDEVEELVPAAGALVINLGTISATWAAAMRLAAGRAHAVGVPWVLDPVAVGVLAYRSRVAADLLHHRPAVIRGNASEILSLAGMAGAGRGVDSTAQSADAVDAARRLAEETGAVVAVTGAVDYVTDGAAVIEVHNGHPLMPRVTGMGCTATAIVGAFLAVERDRLAATAQALCALGVAGEVAAERARGPGSLQVELLDALYGLDADLLATRARLQ